ncbi:hypothetical protein ASD98_16915 [Flavobacterium sp. Root186]|nr:hypothetical protein ASD98_16915 [Flavobacterium sp. Root186]
MTKKELKKNIYRKLSVLVTFKKLMFFSKKKRFLRVNCVKTTLLIKKPLFNQKNSLWRKNINQLFFNHLNTVNLLFL